MDRETTRAVLPFLGQPVGRSLVQKLKAARAEWTGHGNDPQLVADLAKLRDDYGKCDSEQSRRQDQPRGAAASVL